MTPDAPPEVTAVRATVKAPAPGARFTVHTPDWHPVLGWGCTCGTSTKARPCAHVTAVVEALTRKATA